MSQVLHALVVDDEADIRYLLTEILKEHGLSVTAAANSTAAFKAIEEKLPSVIILDIWLQNSDLDGLGILEIVKKRYPLLPVIVISGHGTIEIAVNAIKLGAYDYLEKPFTQDKLMIILKRACEVAKLKRENLELKSKVLDKTELIGTSPIIAKLKTDIEKVAPTAGRVMIHGEVGTGKELAARLIHKKSKRLQGHFILFSPSCMSPEKIMYELFGEGEKIDVQNSTLARRITVLEAANNGTLYIDEVGDLPIIAQTKLLKFLQDQVLEKPTINKSIKLDVRVITSTTKDLQNEVSQNRFRQDLYYRLNVIPIRIPNLSERKEDIPILVHYFVKQIAKFSGLKEREFAYETLAALQTYYWPGNVRQLRNIIEWTLIMNPLSSTTNDVIKPDMLPMEILNNNAMLAKPDTNLDMISMTLREAREEFEKQYLSLQIRRFNYNISQTSNFVGMERSALHRKLKMLDIHNPASTSSKLFSEETS